MDTIASSHNLYRRTFFKVAHLVQSHPGTLNVKLADTLDFEKRLWTRSGAHGNLWHEARCPVPAQITDFQVGNDSRK